MSIIQDALKKVQVTPDSSKPLSGMNKEPASDAERPQERPPVHKKAGGAMLSFEKNPALATIAIAAVLLLAGIILASFLRQSGVTPKDTPPYTVKVRADNAAGVLIEPSKPVVKPASRYPNIALSGIMYLEDGPRAIINDTIVAEGDVISNATVLRIDKRNVLLKLGNEELDIELKDAF